LNSLRRDLWPEIAQAVIQLDSVDWRAKGALVRQGCTDMTEIKETWIKLRHDDADEKIVGHYIVTNGILKMCTASGVLTGPPGQAMAD
jgi:hypothetical protein